MATPSPSPTTTNAGTAAAGGHFGVNVGGQERAASAITGGLMLAYGLSKGSAGGLLIAAAGGAVAYRGVTGHCGVYHAIGKSTADADEHGRTPSETFSHHGVHVEVSFTIGKPRHELYAYWRDFERLPTFMRHLQSVTVQSPTRSEVGDGRAGRDDRGLGSRHHRRRAGRTDRMAQRCRRRRGHGRVDPLPRRPGRPRD